MAASYPLAYLGHRGVWTQMPEAPCVTSSAEPFWSSTETPNRFRHFLKPEQIDKPEMGSAIENCSSHFMGEAAGYARVSFDAYRQQANRLLRGLEAGKVTPNTSSASATVIPSFLTACRADIRRKAESSTPPWISLHAVWHPTPLPDS